MVRGTRALSLLTVLILLSSYAAAQGFVAGFDVENERINPGDGEPSLINISVTNQGEETGRYTISYRASNPGWYFLPDYVLTIPPGETHHSILYAEPDEEAVEGNIGIIVTVSGDGGSVELRPSYRIVRERDIIITGMETDRVEYGPSDRVNVTLEIKNVRKYELDANAYQAVFMFDGEQVSKGIPSLIASEPETLRASFQLGQYASGLKNVVARVETLEGGVQDRKTARVRVVETEKLVTEKDRDAGLLVTKGGITVRNEGNTVSDSTTVSTTIPASFSYFATFTPEPSSAVNTADGKQYTWEIQSVAPGETRSVSYRVNYWAPILLAVLLLGSLGLAVREYRKPHVVKRAYRKDGSHAIHLRVENRSGRRLDNVVVKDFIPSICSLVEKFDASPPEKIRQGGEVTELEWELGSFEPGEERILTYSISSQVVVEGEVNLPPAHMEYESRGRGKQRHSHHARADFS